MPQYFKFFKEAVSGKRKVKELEVVHLADLYIVGVERRFHQRLKIQEASLSLTLSVKERSTRPYVTWEQASTSCHIHCFRDLNWGG